MLVKFRFENFKSFREEGNLDLQAAPINESDFHVRKTGGEKVLPLAVIYGANASGKSNVINAFEYMVRYVIDSFAYGDFTAEKKPYSRQPLKPFLFGGKNTLENPVSEFEVWFTRPGDIKERTFNYGFVLGKESVEEEWLNIKAKTAKEYKTVYYRNKQDIDFNKSDITIKSQNILKDTIQPQTLLVSLGAKLNVPILKEVRDWFLNTETISCGDPAFNRLASRNIDPELIRNPEAMNGYIEFISSFDPSIDHFDLHERKDGVSESDETLFDIYAIHKNDDGEEVPIELAEEADGTIKMFFLYPFVRRALKTGGILMIDEFSSELHPLLVRLIMQTFADPARNPRNAQLIITAHDIWHLKDNVLRRDEIWFTEKKRGGESVLYSLYDFEDDKGNKIRKDEDYLKNYLSGKYGAIPSLKAINLFDDRSEIEAETSTER